MAQYLIQDGTVLSVVLISLIDFFSLLYFSIAQDELQFITVTGCDSGISASLKSIVLLVVDSSYAMTNVTFACDASAVTIRSTVLAATALDVFVSVTDITKLPGPVTSQVRMYVHTYIYTNLDMYPGYSGRSIIYLSVQWTGWLTD